MTSRRTRRPQHRGGDRPTLASLRLPVRPGCPSQRALSRHPGLRRSVGEAPPFEAYRLGRQDDLLRYAAAIVGPDLAEDVCQEAWMKAWSAWGTANNGSLDAWTLRIVRNCCRDLLRRSARQQRRDAAVLADRHPPDVAEIICGRVDALHVWPALAELPDVLREVLWLREVMEFTYEEIAETQRVPVGTVMSRLHSARKKAARLLRREGR